MITNTHEYLSACKVWGRVVSGHFQNYLNVTWTSSQAVFQGDLPLKRHLKSHLYLYLFAFISWECNHVTLNFVKLAFFRMICQKSHNSGKIAKFEERTRKIFDNLSGVSRWFTSQKTLEITKNCLRMPVFYV